MLGLGEHSHEKESRCAGFTLKHRAGSLQVAAGMKSPPEGTVSARGLGAGGGTAKGAGVKDTDEHSPVMALPESEVAASGGQDSEGHSWWLVTPQPLQVPIPSKSDQKCPLKLCSVVCIFLCVLRPL